MTRSTWRRIRVADLVASGDAEVKTGPFGTQLHASDYVESGTPVINVRNIGFGGIRANKLEYIADETVRRLSGHLLHPGDIVFGRKGAVERHVLIRNRQSKWFQGSDCLRLRLRTKRVLPQFLSYYLLTRDHQTWMMQQCSHGATMASLNQDIVGRIEFLAPDPAGQQAIASILSAYDDLIENNTRRIAILEEMARRIYEEWFVHFRFPDHEGVRMVESELGLMPEEWSVVRLDDVLVLQRGFDLPKQDRTEGPFPIISATGASASHHEYKVKGPGVVTGRSGSLGTVMYVEGDFWPLNTTLWVKQFAVGSPLYAFYVLRSIDLIGFNSGAAVPTLNRNDVHGLPVVRPTPEVLAAFDDVVGPMIKLKRRLEVVNDNLRTTRDLLLPKLISGELDISAMPEPEALAA